MTAATGTSSGQAAEVVVTGASLLAAQQVRLRSLLNDDVPARLADHDATLWGNGATQDAMVRLGWLDVAATSALLFDDLLALRDAARAEGLDRVVVCGMGGSSLAPEVLCSDAGVPLTVLDSTHPDQVRAALVDLERTLVVVASKSGTTLETDSQRRAFVHAFAEAGIDPATRIVVVTDPGSALADLAEREGYRATFLADPNVGGRYSALTAFGLVPSALAGVDVAEVLERAQPALDSLGTGDGPGTRLGAALGAGLDLGRDKLVVDEGARPGLGAWIEQLVAESTGKDGRGLLPVVVDGDSPELTEVADDVHVVRLSAPAPAGGTLVDGSTPATMVVWEEGVAIAGRLLGINPFDQPEVESAKEAARALLDVPREQEPAAFVDAEIEVRGSADLITGAPTLQSVVQRLLDGVDPRGYLAVMAYLDRHRDAEVRTLRQALARRVSRPVTFGWGPRFLHSTGQFHKGGPAVGSFLQLTGLVEQDLVIPGRPFTFGALIAAQASGDAKVLEDHGRPVLNLHLRSPAGRAQLLAALA